MRAASVIIVLALLGPSLAAAQQHGSAKVFLNGVATPVFFNDGDSFRIGGGEHQGVQCRLAGFNTLESFGAAHRWGTWTPKELYNFAKLATLNGRRGVWHCESDLARDGYGRMLWWCKDLAISQVANGWATAMSVTEDAGDPEVLKIQQEAMAAKRGMWAHGVPEYVMTSNHSVAEGYPNPYNRLVSTVDGRSKKWLHDHTYAECETPCAPSEDPDTAAITAYVRALKAGPHAALFTPFDDAALETGLHSYVTAGIFGAMPPGTDRFTVEAVLSLAVASGQLRLSKTPVSCMLYVDFTRRYGNNRAACLQK